MKWKKIISGVFPLLILTFILPSAICNHIKAVRDERGNEVRQNGAKAQNAANGRSLVPGHQTAILQNGHVIHLDHLRLLDPYNLIASIKQNGNKLNPILAELLPQNALVEEDRTGENKHKHHKANNSKGSTQAYKDNINSLNHKINKSSNSGSINFTESENKTPARKKVKQSNFDENDFDLYDDYEELEAPRRDFNYKTKVGRRRKKGNSRNTKVQNALLHEAVRKLLGFSRSHSWNQKDRKLLPDPYGRQKIPRYVKELYERFQSGEMNAGLAQGNTIRSIHARIDDVEEEAMFLFNLTSLKPSEHLLNAEIHLYKRRPRSKGNYNKLDIEVQLYRVAPHYLSQVGRITMRKDVSQGWLWYDVTNAVQNCLTPRRRHNQRHHQSDLFALSFKMTKPNGKTKSVSLRKFTRHHSMPFLVLYSNETQAVSFDNLDILTNRLWPKKKGGQKYDGNSNIDSEIQRGRKVIPENDTESEENQRNRERTKINSQMASSSSFSDGSFGANAAIRGKRSIYDNEIPENPVIDDFQHQFINTIPQIHPGILKTRTESRIDIKSNPSFLPLPPHYGKGIKHNHKNGNLQRKRRKKHHRNKKYHLRKSNRLYFPKEWDTYKNNKNIFDNSNSHINNNDNNLNDNTNVNINIIDGQGKESGVCGRKRLSVDFADIGWGDWIISPKSFEAHYCTGSCPFPLNKSLHPSNHATIQSIVHAIGIHSNVPAPCCVPDKMSSVALLYFDEDRNVVLKNYPGMTVDSCACR